MNAYTSPLHLDESPIKDCQAVRPHRFLQKVCSTNGLARRNIDHFADAKYMQSTKPYWRIVVKTPEVRMWRGAAPGHLQAANNPY